MLLLLLITLSRFSPLPRFGFMPSNKVELFSSKEGLTGKSPVDCVLFSSGNALFLVFFSSFVFANTHSQTVFDQQPADRLIYHLWHHHPV